MRRLLLPPLVSLPTGPTHIPDVRNLNGAAVCKCNGGQHSLLPVGLVRVGTQW
jgi:hypothetical protein